MHDLNATPNSKGTILVVDDDRNMVKTLTAVLQLHGWQTATAFSGEEAVQITATQRFAAVLMDVRMPGINGVDAFREIRKAQPLTPVILMTAYAAHELLAQAEREGALMVLPKPIPWPTLTGLLDDVSRSEKSVLLVDDDPDFLASLSEVLSKHGSPVLKAMTLPQALEYLETRTPAVVVLDLRLNDKDVRPADAVLAIKEISPAVVLILYSGHPDTLDRTLAAIPSGWVHASLTKPFPPERLIELLDALTSH
jgi:DNA-binding NtrC family response regulator